MSLRTLLILAAVLFGLGLAIWAFSRESPYPITNEHPSGAQIIALGDSITFGYGAPPDKSYPAQLGQELGVTIVNKGVSGNTSADALARLDNDVLSADPKIVIVCLGGNDVLQHLPRENLLKNLGTIIRKIQERGALVILVGLNVAIDTGLADEQRRLARETGCPFVPDILGGIFNHTDLMSDPVHPNAIGYGKMADKIAPVLRKYLSTDARR